MKTANEHLVTAVSYIHEPTLYKICKAKELIRDAKERILVIEKWDVGGVFFNSKEQMTRIVMYTKMIDRLRNYCRNEIINLIAKS